MSETADQSAALDQEHDDPGQAALEQRARNMGWRPREEFRGDPERWLPPDEFVDRGERMLPLLQERSRAADRTITELQQQIRQQGETLNTMLQSTRKAEQVGYRRAMQELHQQRMRAVEMGDTGAFQAVEQAIRELGPAPEAPPEPQRGQGQPQANNDPVITAWVRANPWFSSDPVANVAMIAAMQQAERQNPAGSTEDHLVEAENHIRRRFPEHFAQARRNTNGSGNGTRRPMHAQDDDEEELPVVQPVRRQPATVARSSDSPSARRPGPRSFDAMPTDVRQQYDRQRKMLEGKGDPLTREEFAANYWEQFEE
jgi:hypothetical protein